jgi:chemotaxis protein methyltransferase CheR
VVSPVEVPILEDSSFKSVLHEGAILHRRADEKPRRRIIPFGLVEPMVPIEPIEPYPKRKPRGVHKPPAPLPPPANYARATELFADADYDGAIGALSALAALPRADAPVFRLLSRAYANKGMLSESEAWCLRAIGADGTSAANRYLHALVLIEQRRPDEAIAALREAIYLEPNFVMAHFMLADLYDRKRKRGESELHLKNALEALRTYRSDDELPESEGMTAGMLIENIAATLEDRRANAKRRVAWRA